MRSRIASIRESRLRGSGDEPVAEGRPGLKVGQAAAHLDPAGREGHEREESIEVAEGPVEPLKVPRPGRGSPAANLRIVGGIRR